VWRYEEALEQTPEPAAHAVHGERLAVLMRELDRLRSERLPKPLDLREAEDRQAREVSRVAQAMAESAAQIPNAEPADLTAGARADFAALAESLQRLCARLAEEAPRLSADQRREQLAEIDATCDGCHSRFRIPGIAHDDG
jgi:cytochrome c556